MAHPQTNGQIEVANKSILNALKKKLEGGNEKRAIEILGIL